MQRATASPDQVGATSHCEHVAAIPANGHDRERLSRAPHRAQENDRALEDNWSALPESIAKEFVLRRPSPNAVMASGLVSLIAHRNIDSARLEERDDPLDARFAIEVDEIVARSIERLVSIAASRGLKCPPMRRR